MIETAYRKRWTERDSEHTAMLNGYYCRVFDLSARRGYPSFGWTISATFSGPFNIIVGESCDLVSAKSAALQAALAQPTREEN